MKKLSETISKLRPPPKIKKNLSLNGAIAARGLKIAEELGYDASGLFEKVLELLTEERKRIPKRKRGDSMQLTLFDRVTMPEEKAKK